MTMNWAQDQAEFMRAGEQTVGVVNLDQLGRYLDHVHEEAREIDRAIADVDLAKILDGLIDVCVVAIGAMHSMGVDPHEAWRAVHAANMRKVIDGKVYRREDGQIGKPPGWYGPEAELAELAKAAQERADKA